MAKKQVVIIDEDSASLSQMSTALEPCGYEVTANSSFALGLGLVHDIKPDLVIIDLISAGCCEGIELCRILSSDDATSAIPIVMVSARSDVDTRRKCFEVGARDFVAKPFDNNDFIARANLTLESKNNDTRVCAMTTKREYGESDSSRSQFISTFALGVAHNFNNLLTAGMGFLSLAQDMSEDKEQLLHMRNLELVLTRMCNLARQLVTFAGDGDANTTSVEAYQILHKALALFDAVALRKHVALICDFSHIKGAAINANEFQLAQAILLVLHNARESIEGDGGRIDLKGDIYQDNVIISVEDNGRGMDKQFLKHVTDPFHTTKQNVGVGMSLAAVNQMIQDIGGKMTVESSLESGTTVMFTLPIIQEEIRDNKNTGIFHKGATILLAVDSPDTMNSLQAVLMRHKILVDVADNAEEMTGALISSQPQHNAVVVDLLRSHSFGDELIAQIKGVTNVPIIYLYSSHSEVPKTTAGVKLLGKPFTPEDLMEILSVIPGLSLD